MKLPLTAGHVSLCLYRSDASSNTSLKVPFDKQAAALLVCIISCWQLFFAFELMSHRTWLDSGELGNAQQTEYAKDFFKNNHKTSKIPHFKCFNFFKVSAACTVDSSVLLFMKIINTYEAIG